MGQLGRTVLCLVFTDVDPSGFVVVATTEVTVFGVTMRVFLVPVRLTVSSVVLTVEVVVFVETAGP